MAMTEEFEPDPESSEYLREAIFEIIENQMRDGDPPETQQTFDRLIAEGYPEEEAMKLIGCALSEEIVALMDKKEEFNRPRFIRNLSKLPKLPW